MHINNKRYNDIDSYFKRQFHRKLVKLPVSANLGCPNRNRFNKGGCIYCSQTGSGDFTFSDMSIENQLDFQKKLLEKKTRNEFFMAYFQSYTNTYANIDKLRNIYESALSKDYIEGISIATRADCLSEDVLDLLKEINKRCYLIVELGLQTVDEKIISFIKRGYSHSEFDKNYRRLKKTGIKTLAHIIVGFNDNQKKTIDYINQNDFWGVKFHNLYIQQNTELAEIYKKNPFNLFTKEEYVEKIVHLLRLLKKDITIHRLTGDCPKNELISPSWSLNKASVLTTIDRYMKVNDYRQGDLYGEKI